MVPLSVTEHLLLIYFLGCIQWNVVNSYQWGHDAIERPYLMSAEYNDIIIIPDPESRAPSDGTLDYLTYYNKHNDVTFRLVVLKPETAPGEPGSDKYVIRSTSSYISSPAYGQKRRIENLKADQLTIAEGDLVAFVIYQKNPISYDIKPHCTHNKYFLQHSFQSWIDLSKEEELIFIQNTETLDENRCIELSYVIEVGDIDKTTTSTKSTTSINPDGATEVMPSEEHRPAQEMNDKTTTTSPPVNIQQEQCGGDYCEQRNNADEDDTDLFRYIIFGPLVVVWIIVTILCTIKLKKRFGCCAKNGPQVQPVAPAPNGQTLNTTHNMSRRPRFARITLSRAPPQMVIPKPMMPMPPEIALPPYEAAIEQPAYPPPAYSSLKNLKQTEAVQSHPHTIQSSVDEGINPAQSTVTGAPVMVPPSAPPVHTGYPPDTIPIAWTGNYGMVMETHDTVTYPDLPPPYQESQSASNDNTAEHRF